MLTRLTKNLTFISRIFSPNFGILFLSLILFNSHQISAQEEQQETFDQNIVNSGESLFKGNCTVCHAINEVVIGPALKMYMKDNLKSGFMHSLRTLRK